MKAELETQNYLYQDTAAYEIIQRFGEDFITINGLGNWAINVKVLKAFQAITDDDVVWERGQRLWRKREEYDLPGRQQP